MSAHATGSAGNPTAVKCAGPGDALDAIPWMLGFHPTESLVMLCLKGPRSALGPVLRFDLLDPGADASVVAHMLRLLQSTGCDKALLVVYTDAGSTDPLALLPRQDLLLEANRQFRLAGCRIRDSVIVRHGRWFSLLCDDPLCCAPEGTPVEQDAPSAVVLAYQAEGAVPPMASRDALVESLVARPDAAVAADLERLRHECAGLDLSSSLDQLDEVFGYALARRGRSLEPPVLAMLIHLAQRVLCRDAATELPCLEELADAIGIWREAYVAAPPDYRPQVGSILAVLAWHAGAGALASSVCESVLELDPLHALTLLTRQLIENHIKPTARPSRAEAAADARWAARSLARQEKGRSWGGGSRGNGGGGSRGNGAGRRRSRRLLE